MSNPFKDKYDFEIRKAESEKIKEKYPNRYPIIVHKNKKSTLPDRKKQILKFQLTYLWSIHVYC